jgi:cell division protein FtsZ
LPEVDTLIVIPNERLLEISDENISLLDAFKTADQVLLSGVQGITELLIHPGLINIDYNDLVTVMKNAGTALMGIGSARGENRVDAALEEAISSKLLETSIDGAKGVIVNFQGASDMKLKEVFQAGESIKNRIHSDAFYKYGISLDDSLADEIRVTVFAAGFDASNDGIDIDDFNVMSEPDNGKDGETEIIDISGEQGNGGDIDIPGFMD